MLRTLLIALSGALIWSCSSDSEESLVDQPVLKVDSAAVAALAADTINAEWAEPMVRFYSGRHYKVAWFVQDSLRASAHDLLDAIEWGVYEGLDTTGWDLPILRSQLTTVSTSTDMGITERFFRFASFEAFGNLRGQEKYKWDHPERDFDLVTSLDSIISKNRSLDILAPKGVPELRTKLKQLQGNSKAFETITYVNKIEPGQRDPLVWRIRERLGLEQTADSLLYDSVLVAAVATFQKTHGQSADSIIGSGTIAAMNVPVQQRIDQIIVNMERLKWMTDNISPTHVMVNVPEYNVRVYHNDTVALRMRAVVGKKRDKTPVFHDSMEYVVMRPYWHVPRSITEEELLPAVLEDPNYLSDRGYQVMDHGERVDSVDWTTMTVSNFPYKIRQRPGGGNALGTVKFIFPNRHQVYLHDTPSKSRFARWPRAFSHGCVRVDKPQEFAEFLLRDQKQWTADSISTARTRGGQKRVYLTEKIPIYIVYYTCTVDEAGRVIFWDDVYGYDDDVLRLMLGETEEIAALN